MRRFLTGPAVILTVVFLVAGCTGSDTADEPITATSATTVAPPETVTTVAPPETVTTEASTTSTTMSLTVATATAEAWHEAFVAGDSEAARTVLADGAFDHGRLPGSPEWEQWFSQGDAWGFQVSLSDCETTFRTLTCLSTWERANLSGKAGVIRVSEVELRFDDQGLIAYHDGEPLSGYDDDRAFEAALGLWMATVHPEAYETFYDPVNNKTREENWGTSEGVAELSPLIDVFVAQSDEYPLSDAAATTATATPEATELRLTFDGDGCTYEGPTELQPGPVELFYVNESDVWSGMNFTILDEGYTAQDVIDQLGPQPSKRHAPSWTKDLGTWEAVAAGGTLSWNFDLEAGVYVMVCARQVPRQGWEGWFGAGLTVEE